MEEIAQQNQLQFKPRSEGKHKADYLSKDIYEFYCKKYGNRYNFSPSEFRNILKDLNDAKFYYIINKSWSFIIPSRLGVFRIRKRKINFRLDENGELVTKCLNVDYKATKELWQKDAKARKDKELIFHFNEHTDGYHHPWFWDKRMSNAKNQSHYQVRITRTQNRNKSKVLKSDINLDYFE